MLLGTLGASLLGNILADKGKGAIATSHGRGLIRAGEGATKATRIGRAIIRAGFGL